MGCYHVGMATWKDNIRRLMRERDWYQTDLAKAAGLPESYVSKLAYNAVRKAILRPKTCTVIV